MAFGERPLRSGIERGSTWRDSIVPAQDLANGDAFACNVEQSNVRATIAATDHIALRTECHKTFNF
jgi:hypothetical protein